MKNVVKDLKLQDVEVNLSLSKYLKIMIKLQLKRASVHPDVEEEIIEDPEEIEVVNVVV